MLQKVCSKMPVGIKLFIARVFAMFGVKRLLKRCFRLDDAKLAIESIKMHAKQNLSGSKTHMKFSFSWSYNALAELEVSIQEIRMSSNTGMVLDSICSPCEITMRTNTV